MTPAELHPAAHRNGLAELSSTQLSTTDAYVLRVLDSQEDREIYGNTMKEAYDLMAVVSDYEDMETEEDQETASGHPHAALPVGSVGSDTFTEPASANNSVAATLATGATNRGEDLDDTSSSTKAGPKRTLRKQTRTSPRLASRPTTKQGTTRRAQKAPARSPPTAPEGSTDTSTPSSQPGQPATSQSSARVGWDVLAHDNLTPPDETRHKELCQILAQAIAGQEHLAHLLLNASERQAEQANAIQSQQTALAEEAAGT